MFEVDCFITRSCFSNQFQILFFSKSSYESFLQRYFYFPNVIFYNLKVKSLKSDKNGSDMKKNKVVLASKMVLFYFDSDCKTLKPFLQEILQQQGDSDK